jgi:hypothetical protein
MNKDKLRNASIKESEVIEAEIDKFLFGDDNELDQNELVRGFDSKNSNIKK